MHFVPTTLLIITAMLIMDTINASAQKGSSWKPAPAPLQTKWTKKVSPKTPRNEYPRPNAVRSQWLNLNGLWEFAFDDEGLSATQGWQGGRPLPETILVPWTFEASLSGIGKGKEIHEQVWYRRLFAIPKAWKGKRVLLNFGAVDWEATVWVNGKKVGSHRGGYTPFSFDITDELLPEGQQEVVVSVYDPAKPDAEGWQPKGKQLGSEGIWYTRTTGIWQTVWLEPVSDTYIRDFQLDTDLKEENELGIFMAKVRVASRRNVPQDSKVTLELTLQKDDMKTAIASVDLDSNEEQSFRLTFKNPDLWTPESPKLYDVIFTLRRDGKVIDEIKSYTGFRSIGISDGKITLNGKPYFIRGVLDQGFWPDGIYTPPTDEAIRFDVEKTKALGFNTARKHVKIEDPRWYYWCDRLGVLVIQDMPSSHNLSKPEAKENFRQEWAKVVAAVRNYPSVGIWVVFNEDWGKPAEFQDEMVERTRVLDPLRPIIDASGWVQREKTDIIDIHDYGNDLKKHVVPHPKHPKIIGEYGGVALPIEGHTWITGWGYQTVKTPEELLAKYRALTEQIDAPTVLSGYIYTQLTDVEQELNGLLTYNRLPKANPKRFAEINMGRKASTKK